MASNDGSRGPNETVRRISKEIRKLRADCLHLIRFLQRSEGISQAEIRALIRQREKTFVSDDSYLLWRTEIEQISDSQDMEPLVRSALERLTNSVGPDWLHEEAKKPYRLGHSFRENPLHIVNGIRVGTAPPIHGPQRLARMLLLAEDHVRKRNDLDFFAAAILVPELAALATSLDVVGALGPEAERKLAGLAGMTDEQAGSIIYELLVGAAGIRAGLDLTMIPEDRSKKVPEYRINNFSVPAVLECNGAEV